MKTKICAFILLVSFITVSFAASAASVQYNFHIFNNIKSNLEVKASDASNATFKNLPSSISSSQDVATFSVVSNADQCNGMMKAQIVIKDLNNNFQCVYTISGIIYHGKPRNSVNGVITPHCTYGSNEHAAWMIIQ